MGALWLLHRRCGDGASHLALWLCAAAGNFSSRLAAIYGADLERGESRGVDLILRCVAVVNGRCQHLYAYDGRLGCAALFSRRTRRDGIRVGQDGKWILTNKNGTFIAGILAIIWSSKRQQYLLLRRAKTKDFEAGIWECVSGRVDQGEGFPEAALREVKEELDITVSLDFLVGTVHFYRGQPVPENELVGVVYHCTYDESEPFSLSIEHDAFKWVTAVEAHQLLPSTHWLLPYLDQAEQLRPKFTAGFT